MKDFERGHATLVGPQRRDLCRSDPKIALSGFAPREGGLRFRVGPGKLVIQSCLKKEPF